MTLAGFRSRWTIPWRCAWSSALAISIAHVKRLVERQSPGRESRGQRVAFEVLHDEKVDLVMTSDVIERADVRVRERGNRPRFAGEPGAHLLIECVSPSAGL